MITETNEPMPKEKMTKVEHKGCLFKIYYRSYHNSSKITRHIYVRRHQNIIIVKETNHIHQQKQTQSITKKKKIETAKIKNNNKVHTEFFIFLSDVHREIYTYWFGTNGVVLTFGCTICPIAKIPPPFKPSKQCANIFLTFPEEANCEIIDVFDFPKPSIPSSASSELKSPDCVALHLSQKHQKDNEKNKRVDNY